jgi:tRNA(Ile)-lysidine synthase
VPFFAEWVDAASPDRRSPEGRARALRYEALQRIRTRGGYDRIATGHTTDDQAETVLLRAVRGAGPAGLAGVAPVLKEQLIVRPLLELRRAQLREYLTARGLSWREDATNADVRVPRNRIRHEVIGPLEAAHPGAVSALARLAGDARSLGSWIGAEVERALADAHQSGEGGVEVDRSALLELPGPVRLHAIANLLSRVGLCERLSRSHLRRAEQAILGEQSRTRISLPRGRILVREGPRLWIGRDRNLGATPSLRVPLTPPRPTELPERGVRFEWRRIDPPEPRVSGPNTVQLPDDVEDGVVLRTAAPGDRMQIVGESRNRPLKELFRMAQWSSWERSSALVITWRERIVWVVGLAGADFVAAGDRSAWELRAVWLSGAGGSC